MPVPQLFLPLFPAVRRLIFLSEIVSLRTVTVNSRCFLLKVAEPEILGILTTLCSTYPFML